MWTIASTTASLSQAFTDTGTVLLLVLGVIVTALVALFGLGYGIRKVSRYITGRKF